MKIHGLPDGAEISVTAFSAKVPTYLIIAAYPGIQNDDPRIIELRELSDSLATLSIEDQSNSSGLHERQVWIRALSMRPIRFDRERQVGFMDLSLEFELLPPNERTLTHDG